MFQCDAVDKSESILPHLPAAPEDDCAPAPNVSTNGFCVAIRTLSGIIIVGDTKYSASFLPYMHDDVDYVVSFESQVSAFFFFFFSNRLALFLKFEINQAVDSKGVLRHITVSDFSNDEHIFADIINSCEEPATLQKLYVRFCSISETHHRQSSVLICASNIRAGVQLALAYQSFAAGVFNQPRLPNEFRNFQVGDHNVCFQSKLSNFFYSAGEHR